MTAQTIIYRGPCEELYGREIEIPAHDCREHMSHHMSNNVETHGLDCGPFERWTEEWWECSICGCTDDDLPPEEDDAQKKTVREPAVKLSLMIGPDECPF